MFLCQKQTTQHQSIGKGTDIKQNSCTHKNPASLCTCCTREHTLALLSYSICQWIVWGNAKEDWEVQGGAAEAIFWLPFILQYSPVLHHSWKSQQCWLEPSLTALCPTTDALVQTPLESDFLGMTLLYYQGCHLNLLLNTLILHIIHMLIANKSLVVIN